MQGTEFLEMSQLIVGVSLLQAERLYSIQNDGEYAEWEQTLANIVVGSTGVLSLHTVFKALNVSVNVFTKISSLSLCILPSAVFFLLSSLEMGKNKVYKVIKKMHMHMDQVGSVALLVSQVVFIYLGAPLFGWCGLSILASVLGLVAAKASVSIQQEKQISQQQSYVGARV